MIEYRKNLNLESLFYINEKGLVCLEEFRGVQEYEEVYQVSDLGRIKSLKFGKEKILKSVKGKTGYLNVSFHKNKKSKTFKTHQLVAIAFLNHKPCGHKLVVNHINRIKTDNRIENLEIITQRENTNLKHLKSSSKYTGVSWSKNRKKWRSLIYIGGKLKYLGLFVSEIDAHNAYQEKLSSIFK